MPLNFTTVKTNLYTWASGVLTGIPVIFFNSNAPRPALPYVTLFLQSLVQIGDDYIPKPDNVGLSEIIGDREFTLNVQVFGGDPITILENLRSSLQKETVLNGLRANNIAFVQHFPINDITELLDSRFEPRASMDILFRIAQTDSENNGLIETVEIEEEFSNGQSIVYNEIVTIPPP